MVPSVSNMTIPCLSYQLAINSQEYEGSLIDENQMPQKIVLWTHGMPCHQQLPTGSAAEDSPPSRSWSRRKLV